MRHFDTRERTSQTGIPAVKGSRTVALDIDGILCDFDGHWLDCARQTLG